MKHNTHATFDQWLCKQIVQQQNMAYALVDKDLIVLDSNRAMNRWVDSDEFIGSYLTDTLIELVGVEEDLIYLLNSKNETFILPFICRTSPTEEESYFNLQVKPLSESSQSLLVMVTDITTQVQWARTLQMQLRKQVEDELRQAKIAAETANRAKSQFLANMSHELRTPLNAVLGYAQILQNDHQILSPLQKKGLSAIEKSGQHLLMLINDILDLSKIEAGKIELYPTEFNFSLFIKNVVDMFHFHATEKGLAFDYQQLTPLPSMIIADEKRLRQILVNLLGNAIKFTDQGKITFTVYQMEDQNSKPQARYKNIRKLIGFKVEDTGIGIPIDQLAHIFIPFRQIVNQNRLAEGTGLGLSTSKHLARVMNSTIEVKSTLGQGSCFWFDVEVETLPGVDFIALSTQMQTPAISSAFSLVPPPMEHLSILHDLAMKGDIVGITEYTAIIEKIDKKFNPFVNKINKLARTYQMNKLRQYLEDKMKGNIR